MKIQTNQTPFQMKWNNYKYKTIDGYTQKVDKILLDNGKELRIYTDYRQGEKETSLQYLLDETGKWIKSKLKYFKGNKVSRIVRGEARKEDIL